MGGQSISLAHLAPFVQVSRDKIRAEVLTGNGNGRDRLSEAGAQ